MRKETIYLICPVRNCSTAMQLRLEEWVRAMEDRGNGVYYPARDCAQDDPIGTAICAHHLRKMKSADVVYVWWDGDSKGSHFDLGMAYALGKPIMCAKELAATEYKSYANVIIALCQAELLRRGARSDQA